VRTREGTAKAKALRRATASWEEDYGATPRGVGCGVRGWARAVSSAATPRDARLALRCSRVALRGSRVALRRSRVALRVSKRQ